MATSSLQSTPLASSQRAIAVDSARKKRGVIFVLMKNEMSQERVMAIAGKTKGAEATNFVDTRLEVVGTGVDWVRLVRRLAKKLGDARLRTLVVVHDGDPQLRRTFTAVDDGGCTIF